MSEKRKFETQVINDEILEKLSLKNRYAFVNNNLTPLLSQEEFNFFKKVQRFCLRFEKKNEIVHAADDDLYSWIPAFGAEGYITRQHAFEMIDLDYPEWGLAVDMLRTIALDNFDPQFSMAGGATVLAINPIYEHHENVPVRLDALKELVTGQSPGAILITEPERG
ncbi:MAG: hypothetical protein ACFE9N_10850, partial [Promethearchaeota archaeon]